MLRICRPKFFVQNNQKHFILGCWKAVRNAPRQISVRQLHFAVIAIDVQPKESYNIECWEFVAQRYYSRVPNRRIVPNKQNVNSSNWVNNLERFPTGNCTLQALLLLSNLEWVIRLSVENLCKKPDISGCQQDFLVVWK